MPCIWCSYGWGLSTAFTSSGSPARDTENPSRTNAADCLLFAGVMRFSVPISSSFPHRPQFDRSFFHCSYCSSVTVWLVAPLPWDDGTLAVATTIAIISALWIASFFVIGANPLPLFPLPTATPRASTADHRHFSASARSSPASVHTTSPIGAVTSQPQRRPPGRDHRVRRGLR